MQLSRSPDLRRLRDEGYEVRVTEAANLIVSHVPFLDENGHVQYGQLGCALHLAGDVAAYDGQHVVYFIGGVPCGTDGQPLTQRLINDLAPNVTLEVGIIATVSMSSKPDGNYQDYYDKMVRYVDMVGAPARTVDPTATAITYPAVEDDDPEGPFEYLDNASSRAGIAAINQKLALAKVVIVGVGGTGSYVLDLISKTPAASLHLYDGDDLFSHNAFRAPGAVPLEALRTPPKKVAYFAELYSKLKRNIVPHAEHITASNVDELRDADFVFLTMEGNESKRLVVEKLTEFGIPFVDVGIGVNIAQDRLQGAVQTIMRTAADKDRRVETHAIAFNSAADDEDVYDLNIQIADLNALNAALAVIRFKKHFGFYGDLEDEHYSVYTIDGNDLINEDLP